MGIARLCLAVLALSTAAAQVPPGLAYRTTCQFSGEKAVKGYVTNMSRDTYSVNGPVIFQFISPSWPAPHGAVQAFGSAAVPPGQTVLVAEAQLAQLPARDDVCQFDVGASIQKVGP